MNATIILSVALAMLSVAGSVKASSAEKFAYNTELNTNNQIVTQCVYKVEDDKYLHQQVKYHNQRKGDLSLRCCDTFAYRLSELSMGREVGAVGFSAGARCCRNGECFVCGTKLLT